MKVIRSVKKVISGIDGSELVIEYDNLGEPYREGVRLTISSDRMQTDTLSVLLDVRDVEVAIAVLQSFLPKS
jgi:hypothetical protein